MERLTRRYKDEDIYGSISVSGVQPASWDIKGEDIICGLAAYEDNGQTPAEQAAMIAQNARLRAELDACKMDKQAAEESLINAELNLEHVTAALSASQAGGKAAVEDIKYLGRQDRGRLCEVCRYWKDVSARTLHCDDCDVFGIGSGHLEFDWRGPREAGKA